MGNVLQPPLLLIAAFAAAVVSGCGGMGAQTAETFSEIAEDERIYFSGTEPFWNGSVRDGTAIWKTPDNAEGARFSVTRFAGNNGLSITGTMEEQAFDLMMTPGTCNDGMSDRTYPFFATVRLGDRLLSGCGWTDRHRFIGPQTP